MTAGNKSFVVAQTWDIGEWVAASFIDQDGESSFHLFAPDALDGLHTGAPVHYSLPSHEFAGPLPPAWVRRVGDAGVGRVVRGPGRGTAIAQTKPSTTGKD